MPSSRYLPCNHPRMRRMNEVALLQWLHVHGPMSRVELAARLELDTKTVTNVVRDLLRRRFVKETGRISAGRGRPRQMLQLNSSWFKAIGIHLEENRVRGAVIDLDGKILYTQEIAVNGTEPQKELIEKIRHVARGLMKLNRSKPFGLSLVFPGITDNERRVVVECAHLPNWRGVLLSEVFSGLYHGRVFFETYSCAKALAERWFGAARELDDFVFVEAGVGIGCVIVSHGSLQTNRARTAGEIGHIILNPRGNLCGCGRRGCLETVASLDAIRQRIHQATGQDPAALTVPTIAGMLNEGADAAQTAVREAARAIGVVLASLIGVLNPSHIVLAGETTRLGPFFIRSVDEALAEYAIPMFYKTLRLVPGQLTEDAALLGSAVAGLQSAFEV